MREVTYEEYREFFTTHKEVVIEGKPVKLLDWGELKPFEPKEFARVCFRKNDAHALFRYPAGCQGEHRQFYGKLGTGLLLHTTVQLSVS